jgi:hypothetical protein
MTEYEKAHLRLECWRTIKTEGWGHNKPNPMHKPKDGEYQVMYTDPLGWEDQAAVAENLYSWITCTPDTDPDKEH